MPRSEVSSPGSAMWRCSMPVRSLIHSSLVSTSRARSSLVMTRFGRWAPTPRITDLMTATLHLVVAAPRQVIAKSWRSGRLLLVSLLVLLRLGWRVVASVVGELPVQRLQVRGQLRDQVAVGHVVADADGAGEPESVHAAMTLDDDAVQPQERAAVEATRVHAVAQLA